MLDRPPRRRDRLRRRGGRARAAGPVWPAVVDREAKPHPLTVMGLGDPPLVGKRLHDQQPAPLFREQRRLAERWGGASAIPRATRPGMLSATSISRVALATVTETGIVVRRV